MLHSLKYSNSLPFCPPLEPFSQKDTNIRWKTEVFQYHNMKLFTTFFVFFALIAVVFCSNVPGQIDKLAPVEKDNAVSEDQIDSSQFAIDDSEKYSKHGKGKYGSHYGGKGKGYYGKGYYGKVKGYYGKGKGNYGKGYYGKGKGYKGKGKGSYGKGYHGKGYGKGYGKKYGKGKW